MSLHIFSVTITHNDVTKYQANLTPKQLPDSIGAEIRRMGYPTVGQGGATDYLMGRLYQCAEHYGYDKYGKSMGAPIPTDIERDMNGKQTVSYSFTEGITVTIAFRLFTAQANSAGKTHLAIIGNPDSLCFREMKWFGSKEWGIKGNDFSNTDMCSQCLKRI